ncbi:carboxyl transferase domain-containing protein [Streptosporangium sp. 'caverna']|uniref:carboxyl transferase domain-containing protein n=1 Tax=Streptosporangium sp. 'caverna' TaxID=2202249 RepID=UPI00267D235C
MKAREFLATLLDAGTYCSWDAPPVNVRPDRTYAAELAAAREKTGLDESVITGSGLLRGRRVAVVAGEFDFLGGSIGVSAAERLASAVERATEERLPLIVAPASGGTRMQEGTVAFLQMIKIATAVAAHKDAALPYLVYLRHPTTGGVLASWGSLGHLTLAEPGALIGFLGPRVYEALYGAPFPEGVQTAENLHAHGLVDLVVDPTALADILDRALGVITARGGVPAGVWRNTNEVACGPDTSAWDSVLATRKPDRPDAQRFLQSAAPGALQFGLPGCGIILALARIGETPCVFVGQDRMQNALGPAAIQVARRGIRLAAELRLPRSYGCR